MAAILSCHYCSSLSTLTKPMNHPTVFRSPSYFQYSRLRNNVSVRRFTTRCSSHNPFRFQLPSKQKDGSFLPLKECAISFALAVGLITGVPALGGSDYANAGTPALPDVSVLISGPPIKDPGTLLRNALPIDNKAIREVQKPLEDITESLKIAGVRALDSVERNVRQASRALKQGKDFIVSGLAESKKDHGIELLGKLETGLDELQQIVEDKNRDAVAPKQKELLNYVGG